MINKDLPPVIDDDEYLFNAFTVLQHTHCKQYRHNTQHLSSCLLYYLDKSFYDCVDKNVDFDSKQVQQCYHQLKDRKQELNQILANDQRRIASVNHYIPIAKRSEHYLDDFESQYTLNLKVQLAHEESCLQYYTPNNQRNSDNMIHHTHHSYQYTRCMIADLCSPHVLECLKESNDLLQCYRTNAVKKCIARFRNHNKTIVTQ
jgi:hypothetical protein